MVYELILQGTRIYRDFYWSQKAIAHASGISVSTLKRVLHDLREAGLIASNYRHMDTCVYDAYESPNQARLRLRLKHDLHAIELQLMNIYLNGDNSATYWGNFRQKLGRSIITSEQVGDSTGKEREFGGKAKQKPNANEVRFLLADVLARLDESAFRTPSNKLLLETYEKDIYA